MKFYRVKWEYDQKLFPDKSGRRFVSSELFTQEEFEKIGINPKYVEEVNFLKKDTYKFAGARLSSVLELGRLQKFVDKFRKKLWEKTEWLIRTQQEGTYICHAMVYTLMTMLHFYNEYELENFIKKYLLDETIRVYFPELAEMEKEATIPEERRKHEGWFGVPDSENKKIRLSVVEKIIKQLETKQ